MPRVTAISVDVGFPQQLEIAQGEDREFQLTFLQDEVAVDFTGAQSITLTVRNRSNGILVISRSYSGFVGGNPASGGVRFILTQSDTDDEAAAPYDLDVSWVDSGGYRSQILVLSTLLILRRLGEPDDAVTSPIPVPYGLVVKVPWYSASGVYQQTIGWSSFGTLIPDVEVYGVVTDSTDSVVVQAVLSSVTPTGCVLASNVLFDGYTRVSPKAPS